VANARAVVLVIDGAGGYPGAYRALSNAVAQQRLALQVESVVWGHGPGRFVADQVDTAYARAAGQQLAQEVRQLIQQAPDKPVYLVAHSAGTLVALSAAELLPPDTLERIVLLAPSVSRNYDVRPALASARRGIDVFCSRRDWFYLGLGIALLGTADGHREAAAGRTGFATPPPCTVDAALFARLHQHPWEPEAASLGNDGGHADTYKEGYLRAQLIPLLWPDIRN
jgi:pimeloyl-ACP methyl ester carboxylesterase